MTLLKSIAPLLLSLALVGCETVPARVPFPTEPIYLLKPSNFPLKDLIALLPPPGPAAARLGPEITINEIGPADTTAPQLLPDSARALSRLAAELPPDLARRAAFLISSRGEVVDAVFSPTRDQSKERKFVAKLRALRFTPATHRGKPIAVVVALKLDATTPKPNSKP